MICVAAFRRSSPPFAHVPDQIVQRIGAGIAGRDVVELPLAHRSLRDRLAASEAPPQRRKRLERPHRGGSHGNDPTQPFAQPLQRPERDLEVLGVHRMARGIALLDREEGARPDVEGHLLEAEPLAAHPPDQLGSEVQPRGGAATDPSNFE